MNWRGLARKWTIRLAALALAATLCPKGMPAQDQNANQKPAPAAGGQAAPAGQTAAPAKPAVTAEESRAYNALRNELDPARQVELVDAFAKNFPSSTLLSDAYFIGAYAFQQQNNLDKVIEYGQKSLQANPDNLGSLLMVASMLPEPKNMAQGSDADKEKKLNDAEADANHALQLIANMSTTNLTPDQVSQRKTTVTIQAHEALGMVHMQRATLALTGGPDQKELAKAEDDYKAANAASNPPSAADFFRLGEIYQMENKLDDAIAAFTQSSKLGQGTGIQSLADQELQNLKKQKDQSQAPSKP